MEPLYEHGIQVAEFLQQTLGGFEKSMLFMSWLGDPRTSFFIYFPVTYYLNRKIGISVLWITVLTEWLNLVFKWLLFGERPFWWIHESGVYSKHQMPKLQQFFCSCETGPGSPSGHAMITAAAWWLMMTSFSTFIYNRTRRDMLGVLRIPVTGSLTSKDRELTGKEHSRGTVYRSAADNWHLQNIYFGSLSTSSPCWNNYRCCTWFSARPTYTREFEINSIRCDLSRIAAQCCVPVLGTALPWSQCCLDTFACYQVVCQS
ncbi:glucose-6-phosphatase 3 isoform X2 [Hypanus sabinus]|uniref:glucose-6-phosphatase 3 isoform X2 n=1 Tax=Hypanus sabinus TaxID=79690 RepID=UPI0028C39E8A|nr:glucose-6-phosphatase 3 isoform X2 [Hypanus sabinus]